MNWSRTAVVIIVLISIYLIFFLFSDVGGVISAIIKIDKTDFSIAVLLWLAIAITTSVRWHLFLKKLGEKIRFRSSVLYYLAGYTFITSPGGVGAIIRSPFMKRDHDISVSKTVSMVLVERFYDLLGITLVISTGLIFSDFERRIIIIPLALALTIFLIIRNKSLFTKFSNKLSRIKFVNRIIPNVEQSYDVISNLIQPKYFAMALSISYLNGLFMAFSVYFLIKGMGSIIHLGDIVVIFPTSDFFASASMIPGGVGVLEGGLIGLLTLYKIKYEIALSVTILVRLLSTGLFTVIGLICLRFISKNNNSKHS